jgi:tripartite-type tricarboxylate transporter receptor subunit TctC
MTIPVVTEPRPTGPMTDSTDLDTQEAYGGMLMHRLTGFLCGLALSLVSVSAPAQDFPTKPIRLIIPFAPGGPIDSVARLLAPKMSEVLKQSVVIENREGAGGVTGTAAAVRAAPDGYVVAFTTTGPLAISPALDSKAPFDPAKDLIPISIIATVPEMLVVGSAVPSSSMQELISLAKSKPGQLNFGSSGFGSLPHLAGELLKISAGIDIVHVPFRGVAPAINEIIGGRIQMIFADLPVLIPQIESGKLKPVALAAQQRASSLPTVPTAAEVGLPDLDAENWYVFVVASGTPAPIVEKLHGALGAALGSPDIAGKLSGLGLNIVANAPQAASSRLQSEIRKWSGVVKAAGLSQAQTP